MIMVTRTNDLIPLLPTPVIREYPLAKRERLTKDKILDKRLKNSYHYLKCFFYKK